MKILAFVLVVAGCTSSGSGSYTIPPSSPPERFDTMSCATTLDAFCASHDCDLTLDAAEHDSKLCAAGGLGGPGLTACGDYAIVSVTGIDSGTAAYYRDGELVAKITTGMLAHCFAGPASFDVPRCTGLQPVPLAACTSH